MLSMLRTRTVSALGRLLSPWHRGVEKLMAFTTTNGHQSPAATPEPDTSAQGSMADQQQASSIDQATASQASTVSPSGLGTTNAGSSSSSEGMAFGFRRVQQQRRGDEALQGIVHISHTSNNIFVALTDTQGNLKASRTAGSAGFRNARKKQPVAAEKTAESLAQAALKLGYGSVVVKMKGVGKYKQLAVQSLHAAGLRITELQDITPVAYNGCRLPSRRRI